MKERIAVIGGGVVALGFVLGLADKIKNGKEINISHISIFDKMQREMMGAGLPYSPEIADPNHIFNVVSDLIDIPQRGDFFAFMTSKKEEIEKRFENFFYVRYKEKFIKRFGNFSEDNEPDLENKKNFRQRYEKLWERFKHHYLNLETAQTYHPRILYGIYANQLFEDAIKTIRAYGIEVNIHPKTEVTSLQVDEDKRVTLGFNEQRETFNHVVVATGADYVKGKFKSDRYIDEIWPADDVRKKLDAIIEAEMSKRKAQGKDDKVIRIGIEGNGLSAIDVMKMLFYYDGVFFDEEDGSFTFELDEDSPYKIRVDMLSRSNTVPNVNTDAKKITSLQPKEFPINKKILDKLAKKQDGKVALWQFMMLFALEIERSYHREGRHDKAEMVFEFMKFIISNLKKTKEISPSEIDAVMRKESQTESWKKLFQLQQELGIELQGANYEAVIAEFKQRFFFASPVEQLRANLENALRGEAIDGLFPNEIALQFNVLVSSAYYLSDEDKLVRFSAAFSRLLGAISAAIPIVSAKEILALHQANLLDLKVIGYGASQPREEAEKILIVAENGEELSYDILLNAKGQEIDLTESSALFSSMAQSGLIDYDASGRINKRGFTCENLPNVSMANGSSSISKAFRNGTIISDNFAAPEIALIPEDFAKLNGGVSDKESYVASYRRK